LLYFVLQPLLVQDGEFDVVTVGDLLLVGEWLVYSEPVGLFELFYPLFFSLFLEVGAGLIVGLFVLLTLFGLQPFPIQVGRYVVVGE